MTFKLNKTLEKDSFFVTQLELCQVRLINNTDFPWLIVVPQKPNLVEMMDLNDSDYDLLNAEIKIVSKALKNIFMPDKLNIASLGNVVSQLHVHIIARYKSDILFPKPVWGHKFTNYSPQNRETRIETIQKAITKIL